MVGFLKSLLKRYGEDDVAGKAAALAYYTIFSIGPLLFLIFGILGELLKSESYRAKLIDQLQSLVGPQAGMLINDVLTHQTLSSKTGAAFAIGIVGLILGAIGIFGQLQKSLDNILGVKVGPDAGLKPIIKQKIISLGLVGVICFLLLVSLVASAVLSAVAHHFNAGGAGFLFHLLDFVLSTIVFGILLTMLYRTLPDVRLPWKVLFSASLIVAVFFSIGKTILGLIIGNNGSISAFGAAGSLIALLLWVFYSGQIIYLGASGISLYAQSHGVPMRPRYKGKRGVLRIRRVEEPLPESAIMNSVKYKFIEGFKKGLRPKK